MASRAVVGSLLCGSLLGCGSIYHVDSADAGARPVDASPDAPVGISLVQTIGSDDGSATSLTIDLGASPRTGDLLVLFGSSNQSNLASVTGKGTWKVLDRTFNNANLDVWYAVADGSPAPIVLTPSNVSAPGEMWATVSEWSGTVPGSHVASGSGGGASDEPIDPGPIAISAGSLVLYGFTTGSGATFEELPDPPWTPLGPIDGPVVVQRTYYQVSPRSGTVQESTTFSDGKWDAAIVAFSPAQ